MHQNSDVALKVALAIGKQILAMILEPYDANLSRSFATRFLCRHLTTPSRAGRFEAVFSNLSRLFDIEGDKTILAGGSFVLLVGLKLCRCILESD